MVRGGEDPVDVTPKRPYMAQKLRTIRGDKSIDEFCRDINYLHDIWWEFEENLKDPSWFLLSKLCHELGINPAWLLEDEGPMLKADICCTKLNIELLQQVIREAEIHESINPGSLPPEKKAELMSELYAMRAGKQR
jgi:hypothetical protein